MLAPAAVFSILILATCQVRPCRVILVAKCPLSLSRAESQPPRICLLPCIFIRERRRKEDRIRVLARAP